MIRLGAVLAFAAAMSARGASAQITSAGVLDDALKHFRTAAESWEAASQAAAMSLFWSLATISLVWTMGQLALKRADLGEVFSELVRYLVFTGFWAWMLENGPEHARLIMDSMQTLGGQATERGMLTPSRLMDIGFHLLERALSQSSLLSVVNSTIAIVLALVVLVVLSLVAVNMLVLLVAIWVVAYGGLIILGFGGARWTHDMAINYYRTVLSLALQAFAMALIVGVGQGFMEGYADALGKGNDADVAVHEQAVLLVVAITLLCLVNRVPPLLGGLVTGASSQYSLGSGAGAAAAFTAGSAALAAGHMLGGDRLMRAATAGVSAISPLAGALGGGAPRGGVGGGGGPGGGPGGGDRGAATTGGSVFAMPSAASLGPSAANGGSFDASSGPNAASDAPSPDRGAESPPAAATSESAESASPSGSRGDAADGDAELGTAGAPSSFDAQPIETSKVSSGGASPVPTFGGAAAPSDGAASRGAIPPPPPSSGASPAASALAAAAPGASVMPSASAHGSASLGTSSVVPASGAAVATPAAASRAGSSPTAGFGAPGPWPGSGTAGAAADALVAASGMGGQVADAGTFEVAKPEPPALGQAPADVLEPLSSAASATLDAADVEIDLEAELAAFTDPEGR